MDLSKQFIDVHHVSGRSKPPHQVAQSDFLTQEIRDYQGEMSSYKDETATDSVIFTGTGETAKDFHRLQGERAYRHTYRIPLSALEPTVMADDSDFSREDPSYQNTALSQANVDNPELFESVPARRFHTVQRGKVQPYRNYIEGPGHISFVIPKADMNKLGVQFMGTASHEDLVNMSSAGASEEELYGTPHFRHPGATR